MAAVVSSFNRKNLLAIGMPALYAALRQCDFASVIIVYDAGSTDGSKEFVEAFATDSDKVSVELICAGIDEDSSFSAGVNQAARLAAGKFPELEYLMLFETDNWIAGPEPIWLACQLLSKQKRVAAVGFTVSNHEGTKIGYGTSFPKLWQFVLGQNLTYIFRLDTPRQIWTDFKGKRWTTCDVVFTSPILIRKTAWFESDGFDQIHFPFSDCDTDWSYRLSKLGWQLAVLDVDGVVHDNQQQLSAWSANRAKQFHQARYKLFRLRFGSFVDLLKPLLFLRHGFECVCLFILVALGKRHKSMLQARKKLLLTCFQGYTDK
jgi:GT2 family glycosyltransferase